MFTSLKDKFEEILKTKGLNEEYIQIVADYSVFIIVLIIAIVAYIITRKIILGIVHHLTKKSKTQWDDVLLEKKFFSKVSYFIPAYIIFAATPLVLVDFPQTVFIIQSALKIYMIIVLIMSVNAFLNAVVSIYEDFEVSRKKPIKGYIQVVKIIIVSIGIIAIIASLFGKNPLHIVGGLGAFTAVLLLVFKDPILGFVGGIQLSANNMLQAGDWIAMPKYGVDGTVTDIALTTVKVQNWDKTISTIPTYSLISDSFKNWRGMEESGGRRIKRSINLDMNSIKFATPEMLEKFKKFAFIEKYIEEKKLELDEFNKQHNFDDNILVNGKRQTNIGIFRAYLVYYLKNNPNINTKLTFLIRQLHPTEKGLPLEIYVFSKVQEWAKYEGIQSDIFDHVMAVIPEFDLKVFQSPSGADFNKAILPK